MCLTAQKNRGNQTFCPVGGWRPFAVGSSRKKGVPTTLERTDEINKRKAFLLCLLLETGIW